MWFWSPSVFFSTSHSISFWFKERFQWLSDKSHRLCSSMLLLSSKKAATICQFDLVNKRVTERADSKRLLTISNILVPCYCGNLFIHFPNFRIIIWAFIFETWMMTFTLSWLWAFCMFNRGNDLLLEYLDSRYRQYDVMLYVAQGPQCYHCTNKTIKIVINPNTFLLCWQQWRRIFSVQGAFWKD